MEYHGKKLTSAGTDIEAVKKANANSGLTYNEVKALLAESGGAGTARYSDTNVNEMKEKLNEYGDGAGN
ncbi:hypothetical protein [Bacillus marinisedimentorum]|uniref:hypothetical protein n=1 Tax=Bacillus marinisedimentorum TaxID=1821260 RepID=UPI0008724E52|nr:hypothetical protein [Bacillus marinisedimentorum]